MGSGDFEQRLVRRDVLRVAEVLAEEARGGDPAASAESRVRIGAALLVGRSGDADLRAALRPVFAVAVPDQRALIALGDIDSWLRDGRIARGWWARAAAGPDPELAALGAWREARAHLRGGRDDDAVPLLVQADEAGVAAASLALGRILADRDDDEAAAGLLRRSGSDEGALRLAELRLRADDVDSAEDEIAGLSATPRTPGSIDLPAWEHAVRGEIAFRRGFLEDAEAFLSGARNAPGDRGRHVELRLAQIAIADGDASGAYSWTTLLAHGSGPEADQARLLMRLHRDLIAEGAPVPQEEAPMIDGDVEDEEED
ncbi:hypothetical protein [Actinomycetospora sp.]|uniref:hypothetical protein n=1 Tax=Actinomycetospora sp. TaxID=1872135 RepID=UPI002F409E42